MVILLKELSQERTQPSKHHSDEEIRHYQPPKPSSWPN